MKNIIVICVILLVVLTSCATTPVPKVSGDDNETPMFKVSSSSISVENIYEGSGILTRIVDIEKRNTCYVYRYAGSSGSISCVKGD